VAQPLEMAVRTSKATIVAIDQYAEAALGDREFFLHKPYGIGGRLNAAECPGGVRVGVRAVSDRISGLESAAETPVNPCDCRTFDRQTAGHAQKQLKPVPARSMAGQDQGGDCDDGRLDHDGADRQDPDFMF
jgi:hypothetical protein